MGVSGFVYQCVYVRSGSDCECVYVCRGMSVCVDGSAWVCFGVLISGLCFGVLISKVCFGVLIRVCVLGVLINGVCFGDIGNWSVFWGY